MVDNGKPFDKTTPILGCSSPSTRTSFTLFESDGSSKNQTSAQFKYCIQKQHRIDLKDTQTALLSFIKRLYFCVRVRVRVDGFEVSVSFVWRHPFCHFWLNAVPKAQKHSALCACVSSKQTMTSLESSAYILLRLGNKKKRNKHCHLSLFSSITRTQIKIKSNPFAFNKRTV